MFFCRLSVVCIAHNVFKTVIYRAENSKLILPQIRGEEVPWKLLKTTKFYNAQSVHHVASYLFQMI